MTVLGVVRISITAPNDVVVLLVVLLLLLYLRRARLVVKWLPMRLAARPSSTATNYRHGCQPHEQNINFNTASAAHSAD